MSAVRWPCSTLRAATVVLALACVPGCGGKPETATTNVVAHEPPELLSSYGLFKGNGSTQEPVDGVTPYDVNTPLFSDYAHKLRFVRIPPGTKASFRDPMPFEFPYGTVLVKTFAYLLDERDPSKGRRLVETRLLLREPDGWHGLAYVWNDAQTEARLRIAGADRDIRWMRKPKRPFRPPSTNVCPVVLAWLFRTEFRRSAMRTKLSCSSKVVSWNKGLTTSS